MSCGSHPPTDRAAVEGTPTGALDPVGGAGVDVSARRRGVPTGTVVRLVPTATTPCGPGVVTNREPGRRHDGVDRRHGVEHGPMSSTNGIRIDQRDRRGARSRSTGADPGLAFARTSIDAARPGIDAIIDYAADGVAGPDGDAAMGIPEPGLGAGSRHRPVANPDRDARRRPEPNSTNRLPDTDGARWSPRHCRCGSRPWQTAAAPVAALPSWRPGWRRWSWSRLRESALVLALATADVDLDAPSPAPSGGLSLASVGRLAVRTYLGARHAAGDPRLAGAVAGRPQRGLLHRPESGPQRRGRRSTTPWCRSGPPRDWPCRRISTRCSSPSCGIPSCCPKRATARRRPPTSSACGGSVRPRRMARTSRPRTTATRRSPTTSTPGPSIAPGWASSTPPSRAGGSRIRWSRAGPDGWSTRPTRRCTPGCHGSRAVTTAPGWCAHTASGWATTPPWTSAPSAPLSWPGGESTWSCPSSPCTGPGPRAGVGAKT